MQPSPTASSGTKIDIIIPTVRKDLEVLPYVVSGARANIRHPIGRVYIVAPSDPEIRAYCERNGCTYVEESALLPITKEEIGYTVNGIDRSGWLLQQFIKLSGDRLCEQEFYLVIDSDTVFIRPNCFERGGRVIFHTCDEYHPPYFAAYEKLVGLNPASSKSFCSHYMLFEQSHVSLLKKHIENRWQTPWYRSIMMCVDRTHTSGFADYETYGNFVLSMDPGHVELHYWHNRSIPRPQLKRTMEKGLKKLALSYNTLSFHSWNKGR
ncbi:DUF6492 family protein [Paenibacillus sp. GYB004]|uniref:DUF6492 family protein n=1 Tax=Paenibacillus sp. GYB004 TaxID=2994393 RepID=UPI002F960C59